MEAFVHTLGRSAKACLAGKRVEELELAPHHNTPRRLLGLLDIEGTPTETKIWAESIIHHREDLLAIASLLDHGHDRVIIVVASVHEYVLLP